MNPSYQHYATHDESEYPELWEGCVGAWAPCLGPTGSLLYDNSGRGRNGTLTNMDTATDWVVDGGRNALDFDGTNDFVDLGVIPITGNASVAFWVKFGRVIGSGSIFSDTTFGGIAKFLQIEIGRTSGRIGVLWGSAIILTSPTNLTTGIWYLIGVTQKAVFGGYEAAIYINGKFDSSTTTATAPSVGERFSIARPGLFNGQYMQGRLGELSFWNRDLSAGEFANLYGIGRGGMYQPRRRRKAYSFGPTFNAAWARGANQFVQPSMIGVA